MQNLIPSFIAEKFIQHNLHGAFDAATLFLDIPGFTAWTDALMQYQEDGAEVLTDALNRIMGPLVEAVYAHGGFISTFAGDAFTALFPLRTARSARRKNAVRHAAQVALYVQEFFNEQGSLQTRYGDFALTARVGLSAGDVYWGILGEIGPSAPAAGLRTYFFRGQAVEACTRAEGYAERGQVVADQYFLTLLGERYEAVALPATPGYFELLSAEPVAVPARVSSQGLPAQVLADFVIEPAVNFSASGAGGEFRQVTPVFVSFNEPNLERLNAFVSIVMQLAADYGGYFNKLDFGDKGGLILVLFGAPIAHENDLGRAADFLLALQRSVNTAPLLNPPGRSAAPRPGFQWRAGFSHGTVFAGMVGGARRGEYTAIGTVVNLAARLMQGAPWGSLWLDEATARRLQRGFAIDQVGTHNFKGFAEAHQVYCLKGQRVAVEGSRRGTYSGELHGRESEISQLQAFVQPIFEGKFGGMLVVTGEAGIGKSRLVHEFAWKMQESMPVEQAPLWMLAQTNEVLRQSLNPFRYALYEYFGQSAALSDAENKLRFDARLNALTAELTGSALRQELERTRPFLGALLDLYWPGSLYDQLEPKLRFENTLLALTTLLRAESLRQPVIVFLEDLQWLDADTRHFLLYFSRVMGADERVQYPVIVLATARELPEEEWFAPSVRQHTLPLNPLPDLVMGDLARDVLGALAAPELVTLIRERSDGNPFFAEQILLYLLEQGMLAQSEAGLRPAGGGLLLPGDVRAVLATRLDRLTQDVKRVVQTAAALGRQFEVPVLTRMLRADVTLADKLSEGVRQDIWFALSEANYLFRHAMMRDVAYEMQLRTHLRELHSLALEAIETIYAADLASHYDDLAYHAERSQDADRQRLYYRKAGEAAQSAYRNTQAIEYFERLLPLLKDLPERIDVRLRIGAVLELIGRWKSAEVHYREALDLAESLQDALTVARCQQALGVLCRQRGDYDAALEWLELTRSGYERLQDRAGLSRAYSDVCMVYWRRGEFSQATRNSLACLELARQVGDQRTIASGLNILGNIAWGRQEFANAQKYYEESLAIRRKLGDKRDIAGSLNNLALVLDEQGMYEEAWSLHQESLKIKREIGDEWGAAMTLNNIGWMSLVHADLDSAQKYFEEYLRLCRAFGDQWSQAVALNNLGLVSLRRGAYADAGRLFEENLELCQRIGDKAGAVSCFNNLSLVALAAAETERARCLLTEAFRIRKDLEERRGPAYGFVGLAGVDILQSQLQDRKLLERAVRFSAFAEKTWANFRIEEAYLRQHHQNVEAARAVLDEAAFAAAWQAGSTWTFDQAIENCKSALGCQDEDWLRPAKQADAAASESN